MNMHFDNDKHMSNFTKLKPNLELSAIRKSKVDSD